MTDAFPVVDSKEYQKYRDNESLGSLFEQYNTRILAVRWDENDVSIKVRRTARIDGEMTHIGVDHFNNLTKEHLFGDE